MSFQCLSTISSEKCDEEELDCPPYKCRSDLSLIESVTSGFLNVRSRTQIYETPRPPNIPHELNVAKSLLQQGSSRTGDTAFDHLVTLIHTFIKDPRENVVDYFEEFSFNLREQKFRIKERFPLMHYEPPATDEAYKFMFLVTNLPNPFKHADYDVCKVEHTKRSEFTSSSSEDLLLGRRLLAFNENVTRLFLYWALCGFGMLYDEVLQLGYALQKIQYQPAISHARFWGKIYGLRKPYYIVEAKLTLCEAALRLERMREEMMEKMNTFEYPEEEHSSIKEDDPCLIPGFCWQNSPEEDLIKMTAVVPPVPRPQTNLTFDIPPEAIGTGVNRVTYFVVNDLNDEWIELPIVTPAQITIARQIKKFLTGDLEAEIVTYPSFPGTEKHYLRAMIARITAGTYIAPEFYYRRLTKRERQVATGEELSAIDEDTFGEEEEEQDMNNDALITENEAYEPNMRRLMNLSSWVHVRPNILQQGRVVYFDEIAARRAMEAKAKRRETMDEEMEEEMEEEGGQESLDGEYRALEAEPSLFAHCSDDKITEFSQCWNTRYSSNYNQINQLVMARSNIWPGAFSFTFEKYADSIYFGWGYKYKARNMTVPHIPPIQYDYFPDEYLEMTDPTPEMEQAWWLWMKRKEVAIDTGGEGEGEEEERDSCDYQLQT